MFHLKKNRIESVPSENEHVGDDDSIDGDDDGNDGGQGWWHQKGLIPAVDKMSDFDTRLWDFLKSKVLSKAFGWNMFSEQVFQIC